MGAVISRVGPGAVTIPVHIPHQRGGHAGEDDEAHEGRRRLEGSDETGRREPGVEVLDPLLLPEAVGGGPVTVLGILGPRGVNAGCRVAGRGGGTVGWAVDWGAVVMAMVIHDVEGQLLGMQTVKVHSHLHLWLEVNCRLLPLRKQTGCLNPSGGCF